MDVKRDNRLLQAAVPFLFSVGLQNVVDNAIYGALRKEQQLYPYKRIIVKGVDGSFFYPLHVDCIGECLRLCKEKMDAKNIYLTNPAFDRSPTPQPRTGMAKG